MSVQARGSQQDIADEKRAGDLDLEVGAAIAAHAALQKAAREGNSASVREKAALPMKTKPLVFGSICVGVDGLDVDRVVLAALEDDRVAPRSARRFGDGVKVEDVSTGAAHENVRAASTNQKVVTSPTEPVVAGATIEEIVAEPAAEDIIAGLAEQAIVAVLAEELVVAKPSAQESWPTASKNVSTSRLPTIVSLVVVPTTASGFTSTTSMTNVLAKVAPSASVPCTVALCDRVCSKSKATPLPTTRLPLSSAKRQPASSNSV
jgi:hypothetical protein